MAISFSRKTTFTCFGLAAALTAMGALAPDLAQADTASRPCETYVISHARGPVLDFFGAKNAVVQSVQNKNHPGDLDLQVVGCNDTYFFVVAPNGKNALVRRDAVVLSETLVVKDCSVEEVRALEDRRRSGNGAGDVIICRVQR